MPQAFAFSLCADDFAISPGVSRGILEALDAGALTATSVMTTSPWWPENAAALLPHAARADLGLHLNLTLGAPLGAMPRLAPNDKLPCLPELLRQARHARLPTDEIAAEIDRQCERFVSILGRSPDHIDGHQHVHMLSAVRPLLLAALERRGWRPWLRDSTDRLDHLMWRKGRKKALALAVFGAGFGREASCRGFITNRGFAGFSSFDARQPQARLFDSYLRAPGPRHLVMCHPGYADAELRRLDPVVATRELELRYLVDDLPKLLGRRNAKLKRLRAMTLRDVFI